MDPRSLLAPTFVVMFILAATLGVLWVGIPEEGQNRIPEIDWDDRASVKAAVEQELSRSMYEEFVYKAVVGVGFCLIVFWPFSTAKPNFLVRLILLTFCGFAAAILTGNVLAAQGALIRICIMGTLLIGGLLIAKVCNKVAPVNSKEPLCFRWMPRHRVLVRDDDPDALEKLERLREISAQAPPLPS
ncbi:MAG: hypothetical protein ACYTGL_14680 [Planctomycetota bacterium]|jgi:hypothetical protein